MESGYFDAFASYEMDLHNGWLGAPLLVCSSGALASACIPRTWRSSVLTSARIIQQIREDRQSSLQTMPEVCELAFNAPACLRRKNERSADAAINAIEFTMLSACRNGDTVLFLIKDPYITTLVAPINDIELEIFLRDETLRQAVTSGIDRLLIDDTLFLTDCCSLTATHKRAVPCAFNLQALVYMVRPKKVLSLADSVSSPLADIFQLRQEADYFYF